VNIPDVDLTGCDVLLWKEGDEIYWLDVWRKEVSTVREGMLAAAIEHFPRHKTLCIMNDKTGKPVRISPLAN
jgi:glycerate-2-kinase